jgi:hypothetical protein
VVPFLALGLLAQATDQSAPPAASGQAAPAQTVKVAAHSSRWDYPKEVAPGSGQEVHIVVRGDTLWDLGSKYLGNPYAWPQIWELNKWVKDPHWIYPGDPILVEAARSTVPQSEDQNLANAEVADLQPDFKLVPKPVVGELAFSFQDFIRMPYLVPSTAEAYFKKAGALRIVGHQDATRDMLGSGDFIFLGGGTDQGVKVGDRLVVTTVVERKFHHPDAKRGRTVLGDIVQQQGVVRVTTAYSAQSVAVIERCLDGITQEGYAVPFAEPATIPNRLRTDITSPVPMKDPISKLIYIPDSKVAAAAGDMVIMDRGASDGFKVGDILLSARTMVMDPADAKAKTKDTTNFYLGQMMVIRTEEHSATCRVLRSNEEILVDDDITR